MGVTASFWRNRRVLITGHTGFKGSWLTLMLSQLGAEIWGLSLEPDTTPSLFDLAQVNTLCRSHIGDIRNRQTVEAVVRDAKPEVFFHLAAQSLVGESYSDPVETFSVNVMGLANVLDVLRYEPALEAIVNVTSDKCYENREQYQPFKEGDPMGGHDPYSASKGCAELCSSAFYKSFFEDASVALATARAGNVIGGGDWADKRIVPDILDTLRADGDLKLRNPNALRPWQHVLEPLTGYLILAEKAVANPQKFSQGWNFGPDLNEASSVAVLAETFFKQAGCGTWSADKKSNPHEAQILQLDVSKAKAKLNWAPKLNLAQTVQWILDWDDAHASGADIQKKSLEQITHFLKLSEVES